MHKTRSRSGRIKKIQKLEKENAELRELLAAKDKFFAIVSHNLKNPLNAFIGFSELLYRKYYEWSEEKKILFLGELYSSSLNLHSYLENLLHWSRSQSGTIEFNPESLDLFNIVEYNISLTKDMALEKKLDVVSLVSEGEFSLQADRNMINSVMLNLLTNAIKFSNEGDEIEVGAYAKDSTLSFFVRDNGVGIAGINHDKLFSIDEYFSTYGTRKEKGTGLGMILCKEFVDKHSGTINLESEVNQGTTITVSLPIGA